MRDGGIKRERGDAEREREGERDGDRTRRGR